MSAQHVLGPYWVRTASNGEHQVCGRHGAIVRRYLPNQVQLADADCRQLQQRDAAAEKRLRDAAPAMLAALECVFDADGNFKPSAVPAFCGLAKAVIATAREEAKAA